MRETEKKIEILYRVLDKLEAEKPRDEDSIAAIKWVIFRLEREGEGGARQGSGTEEGRRVKQAPGGGGWAPRRQGRTMAGR